MKFNAGRTNRQSDCTVKIFFKKPTHFLKLILCEKVETKACLASACPTAPLDNASLRNPVGG